MFSENSSLFRKVGGDRRSQTSNKEVIWETESGPLDVNWVLSEPTQIPQGHSLFLIHVATCASPSASGRFHLKTSTPQPQAAPHSQRCSSQKVEGLGRQWWSRQKNIRTGGCPELVGVRGPVVCLEAGPMSEGFYLALL